MMKISVIIPVYNTARTLPRCLDSIICQTYSDWECIVVDDGSTDDSPEIIKKYSIKDKRIKFICQSNSGVSAARNRGIKDSSGEYITFIDSDDYVESDYFKQAVDLLTVHNAEMLLAGYTEDYCINGKITSHDSILPNWIASNDGVAILDRLSCVQLLFDTSVSYWGNIVKWFRRDIVNSINLEFDEQLKYNEDRAFSVSYLATESEKAVNIVMNRHNYHYVMRASSAMRQGFNENHIVELESFKRFCEIERAYFRSRRLNMAIRHAGLTRKFYLTWLAMNMERYDDKIAAAMERIEKDMLSIRDFMPPYTLHSRPLMKRWLQHHKYKFMRFFGRQR